MNKWTRREILYQLAVMLVLLFFFSYVQDYTFAIEPYKIAFFANYMVAVMVINYVLLPKLYYRNRMLLFVAAVVTVIVLVILVDEYGLEQLYFPDTRGTYFPGLVFTLSETLPIMVIFVAFKLAWDFIKKQKEVEELRSLAQENELQFLKSQINPHFLFNNLNNLYAYAIENSPKTPSIILELSSVLRYMLYECNSEQVNLIQEVKHLQDYMALNELRIEHRGEVSFTSEVDHEGFMIAPLILIVFVENAFKHSTSSQSDKIYIHVRMEVSAEGILNFVCINSYLPHTNTENLAHGIGLSNVKKQLGLVYPDSHRLEIHDQGNAFEVRLQLKLKQSDYA
ncbi:Histidine kinase [Reichenbachiella agariperforans]|uniref:Histidine kinase n=1 Tax=Reichenbachiella agariperforans TaxID=156994 RepID=A0A1M6JQY9_REIAG|nr:histidine kinase [Reichenbachiella agariperforans]SHJ49052.1 Histidine kinase [Reichenbachiella agariperforans]